MAVMLDLTCIIIYIQFGLDRIVVSRRLFPLHRLYHTVYISINVTLTCTLSTSPSSSHACMHGGVTVHVSMIVHRVHECECYSEFKTRVYAMHVLVYEIYLLL